MPRKRKINYHEHDPLPEDKFPDISHVASANECTGLMYKTPVNRQELGSYRELYSMEIPKDPSTEHPQRSTRT